MHARPHSRAHATPCHPTQTIAENREDPRAEAMGEELFLAAYERYRSALLDSHVVNEAAESRWGRCGG